LFTLYAALVKNLRGVVVFRELSSSVLERVEWLRRRFRYRDLGLPPLILEKHRSSLGKYLGGKPFQALYYPVEHYRELTRILSTATSLPLELCEAVVLSSLYISPLLVLDEELSHTVVEKGVTTVRYSKELSVSDWKLHLRIADYTILDMYRVMVLNAMSILESLKKSERGAVEKLFEERAKVVERDVKRYWRIVSESGKPFLTYLDPLKLLVDGLRDYSSVDRDWAAGLSIIPCVHVVEVS